MTLVGFDTSLAATSACVLRDDGEAFCTPAPPPSRLFEPAAHSQELLPELQRLLDEASTAWTEVESIAVGIGPGTFTGLRIGVATARALGQALDVPLRPVSSLEALAAGAAEQRAAQGRPLLALIDARRRQVFASLYGQSPTALEVLWSPAVLEPDELLQAVGRLDAMPICVGDWALESRKELEGMGAEVPVPESGLHAVSAFHLCKLAAGVEPVAPEQVRPVYLRLPDAEINRRLAEEQGRSLGDPDVRRRERGRARRRADEAGRGTPRARD
jgi:tRNA threonylcarbamoyladenosine biosynthesis protein TsaB